MFQNNVVANIYNPVNLSREELVEGFVVRLPVFKKLFKDIKTSPMKGPEQHYIIQGPRGSGKTMFLLRLKYAILNDEELREYLAPIVFTEEQYGIRGLFRLWGSVADYLEEETPDDFEGICDAMEAVKNNDADIRFNILTWFLQKREKKLILFIDNIGELFKKLTKHEMRRLKEILLTSSDIRVIGASPIILEQLYRYSNPFYFFFNIIHLSALNQKETNTLLLHLAKSYNKTGMIKIVEHRQGRVEALRRLTGGIPRSIILLFEIFADDVDGDSFRDLKIVLDRLTPLYKHKMDDLSPMQQDIVDAMAMNWDAVGARDIAAKVGMQSKAVSSQLAQLEKNRIIHKIKTGTKNHLYQITERLFNIWYLIRCGRMKDRARVRRLVHFLESWCSRNNLLANADRLKRSLEKRTGYTHRTCSTPNGLIPIGHSDGREQGMIRETLAPYESKGYNETKEWAAPDEKYLSLDEESADNLQELDELENRDNVDPYNLAMLCQNKYNLPAKAEKYYIMAMEKEPEASMTSLAWLYFFQKKNKIKALEYAQKAFEKRDTLDYGITLSSVLVWNDKLEESMQLFPEIIKKCRLNGQYPADFQLLLLLFIAKKQHHYVLHLFQDKSLQLIEKLKPIYYALMHLLREEYPFEFRKMGEELKETVDEVLQTIEQLAVNYA